MRFVAGQHANSCAPAIAAGWPVGWPGSAAGLAWWPWWRAVSGCVATGRLACVCGGAGRGGAGALSWVRAGCGVGGPGVASAGRLRGGCVPVLGGWRAAACGRLGTVLGGSWAGGVGGSGARTLGWSGAGGSRGRTSGGRCWRTGLRCRYTVDIDVRTPASCRQGLGHLRLRGVRQSPRGYAALVTVTRRAGREYLRRYPRRGRAGHQVNGRTGRLRRTGPRRSPERPLPAHARGLCGDTRSGLRAFPQVSGLRAQPPSRLVMVAWHGRQSERRLSGPCPAARPRTW